MLLCNILNSSSGIYNNTSALTSERTDKPMSIGQKPVNTQTHRSVSVLMLMCYCMRYAVSRRNIKYCGVDQMRILQLD